MIEREGFNVREFVKEWNLETKGIGFWRQVWDKDVSGVFRDVLSEFQTFFDWKEGRKG